MHEAQNNGKNQIFWGFEAISQKCFGIFFSILGHKTPKTYAKMGKKIFES